MKKTWYKRKIYWLSAIAVVFMAVLALFLAWKRMNRDLEFVKGMGEGINIGNSLDASGLRDYRPEAGDLEYETYWSSEPVSMELMAAVKEAGFGTVRIPVTWEDHLDEEGNISEEWLERVAEVTDMALDQELYVILNMHHEKWLNLETGKEKDITEKYRYVWGQIADRFAGYDEHLLFESMNEPRLRNSEHEWDSGTAELRAMVNVLNSAFIETVRESGGQNAERYLLLTTYASNNLQDAVKDLKVEGERLIVSVHCYTPYEFCQKEDGTAIWEAQQTKDTISEMFQELNEMFVSHKIPVIITEFGCTDKDNLAEREKWTEYFVKTARENGISYIWWDNGSGYALLNRADNTWKYPELVKILVQ